MQLVVLYGPPAAGKTTIALELQKLTGYKFLENNVTNTPALKVFTFGSEPFDRIVMDLRVNIYMEAARNNINLITTLVHAQGSNEEFVKRILEAVEGHGGKVVFVKVTCPREILLKMVGEESRKERDKLTDISVLSRILADLDLEGDVPFRESYVVDSSTLSATECANQIQAKLIGF